MSNVGKTIRLAVFRNMEPGCMNGWETVGDCKAYESVGTYVRISEAVEIEFKPLQNDAVIQDALRALDAAELKAREDLQRTLDDIKNQRAQLLSLTHKPEQCERCHDTKLVTIHDYDGIDGDADDQPCPDCAE